MQDKLNDNVSTARTISNDPQYFGGYLNMARLNIFNISNYIGQLFNQSLLPEEAHIPNSFLTNYQIKHLNWNHTYSRTLRFLPIVKLFNLEEYPKNTNGKLDHTLITPGLTKDFESMSKYLKQVFADINDFRNDYSHFYSTTTGTNRKLYVDDQTATLLTNAFEFAIDHTMLRLKGVLSEEDFNHVRIRKIVEADNKITTDGLVFLICMFLEREHAFQFINRVKGFKGTQYCCFVATREVFMTFCVKLPHDKFISSDIKQRLIMNMINELNNCPKDLYAVLSEKEREKVRSIDVTNNGSDDNFGEMDYDLYKEELISNIRHSNRFPYFALGFIDETGCLSSWRFHINIGKLELASYFKPLAGSEEQRRIIENVKAFGKLSDFNDKDSTYTKINNKLHDHGFDQFAPHYNIIQNKIGIYRTTLKTPIIIRRSGQTDNLKVRIKQHAPEAFLSLHMLPQIILLEYLKSGAAEKILNHFIDFNQEILNEKFIRKIKEKLPSDWSEFHRKTDSKKQSAYSAKSLNCLEDRKQCLNNVLDHYNLNIKQIPSRIIDYWLNIADVDDSRSFSDRIKLMKSDCKKRLKVIKKYSDDPSTRIPKVGEMATFLAKDIVDMIVDKSLKMRFTSFYYDRMQESLAFYAASEKKDLFRAIVDELRIFEKDGHPFLENVLKKSPSNTLDFYTCYLKEKADTRNNNFEKNNSWIDRVFFTTVFNDKINKKMVTVRMPEDTSNIPYTIRIWAEKDKVDLWKWLNNITTLNKKPIDLPVNLFDSKLHELLCLELDKKAVTYNPESKWNELLKLWWNTRNDGVQWFYSAEREYSIYNEKIHFIPDSKETFKEYYVSAFTKVNQNNKRGRKKPINKQLEHVFKRSIAESEKKFRILQEEDRLIVLMVEKLMKEKNVNIENLQLSNVAKLISEEIHVEMVLEYDNNGNIIYKNITQPSKKNMIVTRCKRKNYTLLHKYRYDRRLPGLFEYCQTQEVQHDWLKKELDSYNRAKQVVFDSAFKLEKHIIAYDKDGLVKLYVDENNNSLTGNVVHKPYLNWMVSKNLITNEECDFLHTVRNKFAHNQFPRKEIVKDMFDLDYSSPIAEQISEVYRQKINDVISKKAIH